MKTRSIEELRRRYNGGGKKSSTATRDEEIAKLQRNAHDLMAWLSKNPHDGRVILPMPPLMNNSSFSRLRGKTQNKVKREYFALCSQLLNARLLPAPPSTPPEHVTISATLYVGGRMDLSNRYARLKWVEDWLVAAGYIADDDDEHLTHEPNPQQKVDRSQIYRVEIVIS